MGPPSRFYPRVSLSFCTMQTFPAPGVLARSHHTAVPVRPPLSVNIRARSTEVGSSKPKWLLGHNGPPPSPTGDLREIPSYLPQEQPRVCFCLQGRFQPMQPQAVGIGASWRYPATSVRMIATTSVVRVRAGRGNGARSQRIPIGLDRRRLSGQVGIEVTEFAYPVSSEVGNGHGSGDIVGRLEGSGRCGPKSPVAYPVIPRWTVLEIE